MTLAASALEVLTSWRAPTSEQRALQRDFVGHVTQHTDGWSRSCLPDHLTASAIVLDHERTHVLLALHRKVKLWLQFGGHIEATDISLSDAARREAEEESGLDQLTLVGDGPLQLDRHAAPCGPNARHHLDVQFMALADRAAAPATREESLDVRWFPITDLPSETDDAVRMLVANAATR
jgi:8-oxo-dGTP pyrophosphatase MutT (NUDIX family)